jgi:hypothetical protein
MVVVELGLCVTFRTGFPWLLWLLGCHKYDADWCELNVTSPTSVVRIKPDERADKRVNITLPRNITRRDICNQYSNLAG